jgi:hypothetical protein
MCPSHSAGVIEGIFGLTFGAMCGQIKLGDEVRERELLEVNVTVVGRKPGTEVNGPLACNIIRDLDVANLATFEICRNDVIRVDISKKRLVRFQALFIDGVTTVLHVANPQHCSEGRNSAARKPL